MKIALATCLELPEPDHDEAITLEAFRHAGHDVAMLAWDDPDADATPFDAVVIRSTWDYPMRPDDFSEWVRRTARQTLLLNPAEMVLENLDKRYLNRLAASGIAVVPTRFVAPGEPIGPMDASFVLKPSVGAGSMDTRCFGPGEHVEAQDWLADTAQGRTFMLQPYLRTVETVGEQSIVVIGGKPTHRIRKRPRFLEDDESVDGPFPVEAEFARLAAEALAPYGPALYARVDVMQADDGRWLVSEVELIEPSLFFKQNPDALAPFVRAVEDWVAEHRPQ